MQGPQADAVMGSPDLQALRELTGLDTCHLLQCHQRTLDASGMQHSQQTVSAPRTSWLVCATGLPSICLSPAKACQLGPDISCWVPTGC